MEIFNKVSDAVQRNSCVGPQNRPFPHDSTVVSESKRSFKALFIETCPAKLVCAFQTHVDVCAISQVIFVVNISPQR